MVLKYIIPAEGVVVIDNDALNFELSIFKTQLKKSLKYWQTQKYKLVSLEIPIEKSIFIPILVEYGFVFHYSQENYVLMIYQLTAQELIPPSPNRFIGVGGIVFNENKEILVVVDKHYGNHYKFPGGFVDANEKIADAVVREVFEETGIKAELEFLSFFRQIHDNIYKKDGFSDIYFIFKMKALNSKIIVQESEIEDCKWISTDEFLKSENVKLMSKQILRQTLSCKGISVKTCEEFGVCGDKYNYKRLELFLPK